MAAIEWTGVLNTPTEPGRSATADLPEHTAPGGVLSGGPSQAIAAAREKYEQGRQSLSSQKLARTGPTLALALEGALSRLSERTRSLTWPSGGLTFADSRLADVPSALSGKLNVSFQTPGSVVQEDKLLSRGFEASAKSGLAAGTYTLTLGLGDGLAYPDTDTLSVTLASGGTNAQALQAVAEAVNRSSLGVAAEVRSQTGVGILSPDLVQTGSFLALTVEPGTAAQVATLSDATGHLAQWLDLETPSSPAQPATLATHQVSGLSVARPSSFTSDAFDPDATTTVAPGTYTLSYTVGQEGDPSHSGDVSITVAAGDTWGEVLGQMARVFGSASPALAAQLIPARRVWDSADGAYHELVDGQALEISQAETKAGWRTSLSGADAAGAGFLATLGLNATARPGSDGVAAVDGQTLTRAGNTFTADRGRVVLDVSETFGEAAPVSVTRPYERLADALSDVVSAYNDLRGLLLGNEDVLRTGRDAWGREASLAESWRSPVAQRSAALAALGLLESGREKMLWLSAQEFLGALIERPEEVRAALAGPGGLLPELGARADKALADGAASLLRGPESFDAKNPLAVPTGLRTETEVEKANQLLDLYDTGDAKVQDLFSRTGAGALLRRKG